MLPYKTSLKLTASLVILILAFGLALCLGASEIKITELLRVLSDFFKHQAPENERLQLVHDIVFELRLPRTLAAALCGGALSCAGVLSQGLFRNPLASPSILGTTTGGSFGAALVFHSGLSTLSLFTLPIGAITGSMIATGFILSLNVHKRLWNTEHILLAGFALNSLFGALTSLVISLVLEDYQRAPTLMLWLLGGFQACQWQHFFLLLPPISIGLLLSYRLSAKLNVLAFGEEVAETLSVSMKQLKLLSIITIGILVGSSVSVSGAIPFVGLMVPHLTRMVFGAEHKRLLIYSFINGMSFLLLSDLIARTIRAPQELQVGVIIALIGAPFFLLILLQSRKYVWKAI